ncbi:hypothetical protein B0H14DRAFT_2732321 [Mycena olivaceomarginata]|nr:hypothetical protein B0H14DRAFT_2732321 [Mycena olivaceomarginata]
MRVPLGLRLSMLGQQSVASGVGGGIGLATARVAAVARTRGRAKRMLVVGSVDMCWRAVGWSCILYARACQDGQACVLQGMREDIVQLSFSGEVGDGFSVC